MDQQPGDSDDRADRGSTARSSRHSGRETGITGSKRHTPASTLWDDTVAGVPGIVMYIFLVVTTVIGAAIAGTLVVG